MQLNSYNCFTKTNIMTRQTTLILCTFLSVYFSAFSQHDSVTLKKAHQNDYTVTDRPPQAVYGELFGRGLLFSANYDRRFNKRTDGLGFSGGMGYLSIDGVSIFTIPVSINYLLGKKGKFFELGAGASYFTVDVSDVNKASSSGSTVIGTTTIGYRSQPENGGFMFRAGFNQFYKNNNFIPYYPYISFGYSFYYL